MTATTSKEYLSTADVAEYLSVPANTVRYWRTAGKGPAYFRVGKFVRYQRSELERWVTTQQSKSAIRRKSLVAQYPAS